MVNYKQGKIYKIECNVTGLLYIGSTCKKKLSQRMSEHRSNYKKYLNGKKKYYSVFKVMENKDYVIILIEDFPCNSKDQLFARERYYTNEIECVNIRKNQGRRLELGEKQYSKLYYETNIDKIKDYKKEYREKNTDKLKIKYKEYYDENTEKIKIRSKKYYDENTEKIKVKNQEKFTCTCGSNYTYNHRLRHMKTKKHLKFLEEQSEE